MKLGKQALCGGMIVEVSKDRQGHYFTMSSGGRNTVVRLREHQGVWKFTLPGSEVEQTALFSDLPKKLHV